MYIESISILYGASLVALVVKNPPAKGGDIRVTTSTPGSGRSPGGGHGNPLQYSCLENPMDRGAWRATVHRFAKSWTRLKQLSTHMHILYVDMYSLLLRPLLVGHLCFDQTFTHTFKWVIIMSSASQMCRVVTFSQAWSDGKVLAKRHLYREPWGVQHRRQAQDQLVPSGEQTRSTVPRRVTKFRREGAGTKHLGQRRLGIAGWLADRC